ncbi:hypothetical protein [Kribbella sp. CA-294648]|uniref:hypothetical protein n=1 Tax=Kribbella sp. CA-294648 TaxID=3239948 RepID=UPI003D8F2D7B
MTTNHWTDTESPSTQGVGQTARDEAGQLKETSTDAARQVAETVKEKASEVTSDAREQTRRLAGQTRDELVGQASQQKDRAADGLRSMSDELRRMAEQGESGLGAQLVRHGAEFTNQAADFLSQREPGDLLEEVRGFARRKPGTFLLVAAAAGIVAGRLTRAMASGAPDTPSNTGSSDLSGTPVAHTTTPPPTSTPVAQTTPAAGPVGQTTPPPPAPVAGSTTPPPVAGSVAQPMAPPPAVDSMVPPPTPTPVAPDPDPGAPVTPRFGPESER